MTSSTSSSRRPFAKTLVVGLVVMGIAVVLIRLFAMAFDASAETIITRVMEARQELPRIAKEDEDIVIAFGSSMTDAGFSARQFDRQMLERGVDVKSFNFGFGGLNPYFQDYLARRMREAFDAEGKRLKLAMIEFTPLQNTKARYNGAVPTIDSYVSMLASDAEILDLIKEDPTRGTRVATIRYLRDDISAEMVTFFFGRQMFGASRPRSDIPVDEEAQKALEEIGPKLTEAFEKEYPDFDGKDWRYEWQGAGTIPEERAPETVATFIPYYEALRNEKRMTEDRMQRNSCCDYENLDFEEELLSAFVRIVKTFQAFSDEVEVILMPVNEDWVNRPADAEQRLADVLDRIQQETGVTIRNFERAPEITPEMFSDTTHLGRYIGDVPFTEMLVNTYAPKLGGSAAPQPDVQ